MYTVLLDRERRRELSQGRNLTALNDQWSQCSFHTTTTVVFKEATGACILQATVRPRYHCLHFTVLHAIYSQFSSVTSC